MMTAEAGAFWILGTDTEIGKTAVAAGLLGALSRRALKRGEDAFRAPLYVKPVQTGAAAPGAGDADRAREAGFPAETLFSFAAPASPALAAKLEGRRLAAGDVLARIRARLASPEAAAFMGAEGTYGLSRKIKMLQEGEDRHRHGSPVVGIPQINRIVPF